MVIAIAGMAAEVLRCVAAQSRCRTIGIAVAYQFDMQSNTRATRCAISCALPDEVDSIFSVFMASDPLAARTSPKIQGMDDLRKVAANALHSVCDDLRIFPQLNPPPSHKAPIRRRDISRSSLPYPSARRPCWLLPCPRPASLRLGRFRGFRSAWRRNRALLG